MGPAARVSGGNMSINLSRLSAMFLSTVAVAAGSVVMVGATPANAAACSDVEIIFARGTGEFPGVGTIAGTPFVSAVKANLPGKSVSTYAVKYAADVLQTSGGAGSADLVRRLSETAAACPDTQFILGGYSQGATVVDKALGIVTLTGGNGTTIPADLSDRVAGVAAFGNPLGLQRTTIPAASPTYGARAIDICNTGDPVCGGGANVAAHLTYGVSGKTTQAAKFVAGLIG